MQERMFSKKKTFQIMGKGIQDMHFLFQNQYQDIWRTGYHYYVKLCYLQHKLLSLLKLPVFINNLRQKGFTKNNVEAQKNPAAYKS